MLGCSEPIKLKLGMHIYITPIILTSLSCHSDTLSVPRHSSLNVSHPCVFSPDCRCTRPNCPYLHTAPKQRHPVSPFSMFLPPSAGKAMHSDLVSGITSMGFIPSYARTCVFSSHCHPLLFFSHTNSHSHTIFWKGKRR